jgi:hypothetical protein
MNAKQRNLLLAAAILFTCSELFPPLVYEGPVSSRRSAGYHFLKSPPAVKSPEEMRAMFSLAPDEPLGYIGVKKDRFRVSGQRVTILFFAVGFWLLFSGLRLYSKIIFGGVTLCAGLACLGYLLRFIIASR